MNTVATNSRQSKITEETLEESRKLKALWDSRKHPIQAVFGEQYDIGNQSAVGQFLNGRTVISLKAARGFAAGLQCEIEDFSPRLAKEAAKNAPFVVSVEDFVKVRRADVQFANGHGQVVYHEDDKPPLSFRSDFLRKLNVPHGRAIVVDAEGESNYPKILPGAVVLINGADREHLNGEFFAFRAEGHLLIKRLTRMPDDRIMATAENSDFKPKMTFYDQTTDDFEVIGRAVWTGVEL